eukprot:TRINITY_DN4036_c0_g2_i1.p1 TRINITY_DN4036_c0_g2~~TRINITY_DN4036_c0_g2_i1.p1  ORF type:complete len:1225 (-),score=284.13 TRINITY_DN4036_c0_g2_i1:18-3692(-)
MELNTTFICCKNISSTVVLSGPREPFYLTDEMKSELCRHFGYDVNGGVVLFDKAGSILPTSCLLQCGDEYFVGQLQCVVYDCPPNEITTSWKLKPQVSIQGSFVPPYVRIEDLLMVTAKLITDDETEDIGGAFMDEDTGQTSDFISKPVNYQGVSSFKFKVLVSSLTKNKTRKGSLPKLFRLLFILSTTPRYGSIPLINAVCESMCVYPHSKYIRAAPRVEKVIPYQGPANSENDVAIFGQRFVGPTLVYFGNLPCPRPVVLRGDQAIECVTPRSPAGDVLVKVVSCGRGSEDNKTYRFLPSANNPPAENFVMRHVQTSTQEPMTNEEDYMGSLNSAQNYEWTNFYEQIDPSYPGNYTYMVSAMESEPETVLERVQRRDQSGFTLLHYTCAFGNLEFTKKLLELRCDLNVVDSNGVTPLFWAIYGGHSEVVKLLLDFNPHSTMQVDKNLNTHMRDEEISDDDESETDDDSDSEEDYDHVIPYTHSSATTNPKPYKMVVMNNPVPTKDTKTNFVMSPVMLTTTQSSSSTSTSTQRRTITKTVNLSDGIKMEVIHRIDSQSPVHPSRIVHSNQFIGKFPNARGYPISFPLQSSKSMIYPTGKTTNSSRSVHLDQSKKEAIVRGPTKVDIDHPSPKDGVTPLFVAILNSDKLIFDLLLDHGADVNITDNQGNSAIHLASTVGSESEDAMYIFNKLLSLNSSNLINKKGDTPLHFAVVHHQSSVVECLIQSGASIHALNNDELSPYDLATPEIRTIIDKANSKNSLRQILKCVDLDETKEIRSEILSKYETLKVPKYIFSDAEIGYDKLWDLTESILPEKKNYGSKWKDWIHGILETPKKFITDKPIVYTVEIPAHMQGNVVGIISTDKFDLRDTSSSSSSSSSSSNILSSKPDYDQNNDNPMVVSFLDTMKNIDIPMTQPITTDSKENTVLGSWSDLDNSLSGWHIYGKLPLEYGVQYLPHREHAVYQDVLSWAKQYQIDSMVYMGTSFVRNDECPLSQIRLDLEKSNPPPRALGSRPNMPDTTKSTVTTTTTTSRTANSQASPSPKRATFVLGNKRANRSAIIDSLNDPEPQPVVSKGSKDDPPSGWSFARCQLPNQTPFQRQLLTALSSFTHYGFPEVPKDHQRLLQNFERTQNDSLQLSIGLVDTKVVKVGVILPYPARDTTEELIRTVHAGYKTKKTLDKALDIVNLKGLTYVEYAFVETEKIGFQVILHYHYSVSDSNKSDD